ncbi:MAG: glycosyltransferase [Bacteroidales bacterium]|nr:glycosyltransferase [Bacteroidales bacterium]
MDIYLDFEHIVFGIFVLAFLVQMLYIWGISARLAFYKSKSDKRIEKPVSVVVTSKDDYYFLQKYLPLILEQDYPDYEVVLVNDHSDDETDLYLKQLSKKYPHLKVVNMSFSVSFYPGKKFPLSIGIKSAKNDILLLTDADCRVNSKDWIRNMQQGFDESTQIILGYGPYQPQKGLLNTLIRYYSFFTASQYLSFALAKMPYMGVGRNLAYRKSLFYKNKGFISHYKVPSGDDDLFVNETANTKNVKICIHKDAYTYSEPKTTFTQWIQQKRRHLSTGKLYKRKHQFMLSLYPFSLLVFYSLFAWQMISGFLLYFVMALFTIRLISFLIIQKTTMDKLGEKKLFLTSPLLELFIFSLNSVLVIVNSVYKKSKWK